MFPRDVKKKMAGAVIYSPLSPHGEVGRVCEGFVNCFKLFLLTLWVWQESQISLTKLSPPPLPHF